MEKIKRSSWKTDIEGTEEWLHEQAQSGLLFKKLDYNNDIFSFEQAYSCEKYYFIDYSGSEDVTQKIRIKNAGYEIVYESEKYVVGVADKDCGKMKHIGLSNASIRYKDIALIGIIASLTLLLTFAAFTLIQLVKSFELEEVSEERAIGVFLLVFCTVASVTLLIVSISKYIESKKVIKDMLEDNSYPLRQFGIFMRGMNISKEDEFAMYKQQDIVIKRIPFATFASYRTEQINDKMFKQGYILKDVNSTNMALTYIKKPADLDIERTQLIFDVTKEDEDVYVERNVELGFRVAYSKMSCGRCYVLWYREYKKDEEYVDFSYDCAVIRNEILLNMLLGLVVMFPMLLNVINKIDKINQGIEEDIYTGVSIIVLGIFVILLYMGILIFNLHCLWLGKKRFSKH